MSNNILNYFEKVNKGFIHPKGKAATNLILDNLNINKGEQILEVGVGTGTTLVSLLSRNPTVNLHGVDISQKMIQKSEQRLRYCKLKGKVILKISDQNNRIPFESNFFDKAYVESVLAIQEKEDLTTLISELGRVLKPNGICCINELVWSPNTKQNEINFINSHVKEKFGIIQANGKYPYIQDWIDLLEESLFKIEKLHNISDVKNSRFIIPKTYHEFLSRCFSLNGKIRGYIMSKLRNKGGRIKRELSNLDMSDKVECYIITACNTK